MSFETASPGRRLQSLLEQGELVVAPGCGDALAARLIEAAGFKAACMSGGWTAGAHGLLDNGLLTLNEMVENAKYIAEALTIPLVSDADTGFGEYVNVRRCVREFEQVGVAGIHLEDQALPKKCGLMAGKRLVPVEEMVRKLHAAVDARRDPDFIIIARTDSLAPEGLDSAIERGHAYFDAGADMLMVEGFRTVEEIRTVGEEFRGRHLYFNRTPRGHSPLIPLEELRDWGFNFIAFPMHLILASMAVQRELLAEIRDTGACDSLEDRMITIGEFFDVLGEAEMEALDRRYADLTL